jgi:TPR repeat protein
MASRKTAVEWFRKAAERGYSEAQSDLGWCFDNGWGVDENKEQAAKWYLCAAEQGLAGAQFNMGSCYEYGAHRSRCQNRG